MIFQLDCTKGELFSAERSELEETFSQLLRADRDGKHLLVLSRETCDWAKENLELARLDIIHLELIREQFTFRGNLPDSATTFVIVKIGDGKVGLNDGKVFSIGHKALIAGDYLSNSSVLLIENQATDGLFYDFVFRKIASAFSLPSYRSLKVTGGGGVDL